MTPTSLASWMERLGYNKSGASAALGIDRATLNRYLDGKTPVPLYIGLACAAIAQGIPPIR